MPNTTALDVDTFHHWRHGCFYPKADLPLPDPVLRDERATRILDEAIIAQICAFALGEPVIVETMTAGTFHWLWRIQRLNGDGLVFRANALNEWLRDFAMAIDGAVGERLRKEGLPALTVHRLDLNRKRCPADFAIMDEAPGMALRTLDNDETQMTPLLRQLGAFLASVHRIHVEGYGLLDVRMLSKSLWSPLGSPQRKQGSASRSLACAAGSSEGSPEGSPEGSRLHGSHSTWDEYLWLNLERHVGICVETEAISPDAGREIIWYFEGCRGLFKQGTPSLLHGDPGSHNVFVQDGKISALIDWEDALAGDPVYEIAFWATFHPERRHEAFIEGYREAATLPSDFALRFWLYYLRIALAKTVLRHRLRIKDQPGREPAALRIRKALENLQTLGR